MMSIKEKISGFKGRVRDLKQNNRAVSVLLNKYTVITLIFLIWIAFFDSNNIGEWFKAKRTLRSQDRQIEFYHREIAAKESRMDHLRSQKDSLETFAREEYGFHEDGEDVYIVKKLIE